MSAASIKVVVDIFSSCIICFSDVDIEDDEGLTPLHYACRISRKRKRKNKSRMDLFENTVETGDVSFLEVRWRTFCAYLIIMKKRSKNLCFARNA